MPAGRFLIRDVPLVPGAEVELPTEVAHQVRDVLRLGAGGQLTLLDGRGGEFTATVTDIGRRQVIVRIGERNAHQADLPVRIVLCQGMLKAAKFEWVLQKGTELGVAAFVPLLTERAVAAAEATGESKRTRWERILAEALEQCGGTWLPELHTPRPLMHALSDLPKGGVALFPWEDERDMPLTTVLRQQCTAYASAHTEADTLPAARPEVRIFIGPEGGFSAGEAALARRAGALPVTLGPRILRAETAALVAVTLTLAALGALERGPVPPTPIRKASG